MHAIGAAQAIYFRWEASDMPLSVAANRSFFLFFLADDDDECSS